MKIENVDQLPDGGPVTYTVDRKGLDIGRDPFMDWTLPDPQRFISGTHCHIRYQDGGYWVHDVSTNGTMINGQSHRLTEPYRLQDGDRIHVGGYIIAVALTEGAGAAPAGGDGAAAPSFDDPWAVDNAAAPIDRKGFRRESGGASSRHSHASFADENIGFDGGFSPSGSGNAAPPNQSGGPDFGASDTWGGGGGGAANWSPDPAPTTGPAPSGGDWRPPSAPPEAPASGAPASPPGGPAGNDDAASVDWRTGGPPKTEPAGPPAGAFDSGSPAGAGPAPGAFDSGPPASSGAPAGAFDSGHPAGSAPPPGAFDPGPAAPPDTSAPSGPSDPGPASDSVTAEEEPLQLFNPVNVPEREKAPEPKREPAPAAPAGSGGAGFVAAFERGAGLPAGSVSRQSDEEFAEEMGRLFRMAAEGLTAMLKARSETKTAMRSDEVTQFSRRENNPLKFSPTVEQAMKIMFGETPDGYLGARETIERSFTDLQNHQMYTFSAMQQALIEWMADLDPEDIAGDTAKEGGLASLVSSHRARLWDTYVERYRTKASHHRRGMIDAFMLLFADKYGEQARTSGGGGLPDNG